MNQLLAVLTSDAINRDYTRFTVGALMSALWDNCLVGNPMFVSHDTSRFTGWMQPFALHMEPGLTRLVGLGELAETKEEEDALVNMLYAYLEKRLVDEHHPEIEKLRSLLSHYFQGEELLIDAHCVAFVEQGLATKVFPQIFSQQDKDGLVRLDKLTSIGPGVFRVGEFALFAHPFFRRSLSRLNTLNVPFLKRFQGLKGDQFKVKIALDPDMVGLASTYTNYIEHEYWWGPKFNDDLASIQPGVAHHEASERECFFHGISGAQFWWQSRDDEHILEIEELREIPTALSEDVLYGCRYVHSIVKEANGQIIHFDGAVRGYTEENMLKRLEVDIAHAGRHTDYTKLWRMDGVVEVPLWKSLLSDYFRDNHLVGEYLGAVSEDQGVDDEVSDSLEDSTASTLTNYVPYSMSAGDGVRIALSCHRPTVADAQVSTVVPTEILITNQERIPTIETDAIELRKIIDRTGGFLVIPDTVMIMHYKDLYANLPFIFHSPNEPSNTLSKTLDAIRIFVGAWVSRGCDFVASYTLGFLIGEREVHISVLGHVKDLQDWLSNPLSTPPLSESDQELRNWSERVSEYLSQFPKADDKPHLGDILQTSGMLTIQRNLLSDDYYEFYLKDPSTLMYKLKLPTSEQELITALLNAEIVAAMGFSVPDSVCSNCKLSYTSCACSKLIDEGVVQEFNEAGIPLLFWTDRPSHRPSEASA